MQHESDGDAQPSTVPVEIRYADLVQQGCDMTDQIARAFGASGLGIITVSGVPGFVELRRRLLPLASRFAVWCHVF